MKISLWQAFAASLLLASFLLPITVQVLKRFEVLDVPSGRSSHQTPTVRGAGIALLPPVLLAVVIGGSPGAFLAGGAILALSILGGVDDVRGLGAKTRLGVQVGVAGSVSGCLLVGLDFSVSPAAIAALIMLAMWIVLSVNCSNFMDGTNGLVAVQAVVLGLGYSWILSDFPAPAWQGIGLSLSAVGLAFLPWNLRTHARAFLGDSGSYLIGAVLAVLGIATWVYSGSWLVAFLPMAGFLLDPIQTLIARTVRQQPLLEAHRQHFYQRMLDEGRNSVHVVSIYAALSGFFVILAHQISQLRCLVGSG